MLRVAVGCVLALGQGLLGQEYEWVTATGPGGPYGDAVLVADTARGVMFAFGGLGSGSYVYCNSGVFVSSAYSSGAWVTYPGPGPSSRRGHAMAFDSQRSRVVMFGGQGGLQDTWEWDGLQWTPFPFTVPPVARGGHVMAFDNARGHTLMHGGMVAGVPSGETWAWNGATWSLLSSGGPTAGVAMAFHQGGAKAVLVGANSTWLWDGLAWHPSAGSPNCITTFWDPVRQDVLLVGSIGTSRNPCVWRWNDASSVWQVVPMRAGPGDLPSGVVSASFDPSSGQPVIRHSIQQMCNVGGPPTAYVNYMMSRMQPIAQVAAAATSSGVGCGSLPLALSQDPLRRPIINTSAVLDVQNAPIGLAYLAIGTSRTTLNSYSLPLLLTSLGFTGCYLRQSMDYEGAYPTSPTGPNATRATIAIPNDPVLLRQSVYLQAWAFAPGENPAEITVSNMISWFIGDM